MLKLLRDVCEEDQDHKMKLRAYKSMGNCYQENKDYKKAIRCFKKVLETAWATNDLSEELQAYDRIGI